MCENREGSGEEACKHSHSNRIPMAFSKLTHCSSSHSRASLGGKHPSPIVVGGGRVCWRSWDYYYLDVYVSISDLGLVFFFF